MKSKSRVLAASVLMFAGLTASAYADPTYPADAEAAISLPTVDRYTAQQASIVAATAPEAWGVSRRAPAPHDPFPFGGGMQDD